MMRKSSAVALCIILSLILARNAHAYIDLGMGSMLVQGLIAGLVAVGIFWRRFAGWLGRLFGRKEEQK